MHAAIRAAADGLNNPRPAHGAITSPDRLDGPGARGAHRRTTGAVPAVG